MEHRQVLENDPADTRYVPGEVPVVEEPEPAEVKDEAAENETRGFPEVEDPAVEAAKEVVEEAAADGGISAAEVDKIEDAIEEVAADKPAKKAGKKKEA